MELPRSNSLPLARTTSMVNGDPLSRFIDDTNIQILIEPANSKQLLYHYAFNGKWDLAHSIYDDHPYLVPLALTAGEDTALHVAVSANNSEFVKGLVNLECITPHLEMQNADGNTAFCIAAITGNKDFLQIMLKKNQKLPLIGGHGKMLPVHFAALSGYHEIVQCLSSDNLLQKMNLKDIKKLLFMTINSGMYDVATILVEKYPHELTIARNEENLTALHVLARKSSPESDLGEINKEISSAMAHQMVLLDTLWSNVRKLQSHEMLELMSRPSVVIFDAVKSGNDEIVIWILSKSRELLTIKDPETGQTLLHFAVLHRQKSIFEFINERQTVNLIQRAVDNNRNNVLHFAAHQKVETTLSLRPRIQMHEDLAWFKEVEKKVPHELQTMRNSNGETPKDILYANRKKLSNVVKKETKEIARSSMVVATLVAGVAFGAALKVPSDKSSVAFVVFILANSAALFTSAASIISFLSIYIFSRFTKIEFIISLHPSLIIGLTLLLISIVTIVTGFAAAGFFIFDNVYKWVACVAASFAILPVFAFLQFRFTLLCDLRDYVFFKSNN